MHLQSPYLSQETTATYGAISPLWFGKGEGHIAQRAETMEQHDRGDTDRILPRFGPLWSVIYCHGSGHFVSASSATPSWFWSIDDKLGCRTNVFVRIAG